jgi:hypothetical protein
MSLDASAQELFLRLCAETANAEHSTDRASKNLSGIWSQVDSPVWQELVSCFAAQQGRQYATFGLQLLRHGVALLRQSSPTKELDDRLLSDLFQLYAEASPKSDSTFQAMVLNLLASAPQESAWETFVKALAEHTPEDPRDIVLAMGPLFSDVPEKLVASLFPALSDYLGKITLAAPILDLANFYTRRHCVSEHPLKSRATSLAEMLGQMAQRVLQLEESPPESQEELVRRGQQVHDSVAIMIGLVDALALIDDPQYVGKIYPLLDIAHRRLRVEAASALAKLGEKAGAEALCELAAESSVRLRVLAYAEELGIDEQIDESFRLPESRAEGELVAWLAEPTQFAVPPDEVSLFDQRSLYWPGFDDPIDCFLFRFNYSRETGLENIGIAGPGAKTVACDLLDLPPQQIYSLFAGLDAEHNDIYQVSADEPSAAPDVQRLLRRVSADEYTIEEPLWLGVFFEFRAVVARAVRERTVGTVIIDDADVIQWTPAGSENRPIRPEDAYAIYKGRRLLESFNDDFS